MYRSEQKIKFIKQYTLSANTATRCEALFERIAPIEQSITKDVSEMTESEFSVVLSEVCGVTRSTEERMTLFLRDYIKWCVDTDVSNANPKLLEVVHDPSYNIREGLYKNPAHLQKALNSVFLPVEEHTVHNVYRAYIWSLYIGLQQPELETIEKTAVDFERSIVLSESGAYSIYMEAIPSYLSCVNQTRFRYIHNLHGTFYFKDRADSKLLLSRTSAVVKCQELINSIGALCRAQECSYSFRADRLRLSGIFYRMYQRETEDGFPVDFHLFAEQDVRAKRLRRNETEVGYAAINKAACLLKQNYTNWKIAFGL